jgi:hypothetical protein
VSEDILTSLLLFSSLLFSSLLFSSLLFSSLLFSSLNYILAMNITENQTDELHTSSPHSSNQTNHHTQDLPLPQQHLQDDENPLFLEPINTIEGPAHHPCCMGDTTHILCYIPTDERRWWQQILMPTIDSPQEIERERELAESPLSTWILIAAGTQHTLAMFPSLILVSIVLLLGLVLSFSFGGEVRVFRM